VTDYPSALNSPQPPAYPPHQGSPVQPSIPYQAGTLLCRFCNNGPAVQTTFRQHTGMIILMKMERIEGPFCHNCGLAAFRSTTAHTLIAGWWGWISVVAAPITILVNLINRRKVAKLAPAQVIPGGMTPADPGKPVYLRPQFLGLFVPVVLAGLITLVAISDKAENQVGKCIQVSDNQVDVKFVDCDLPHDGVITAVADRADLCPADSIGAVSRQTFTGVSQDDGKVLCIGKS
jgi:hypothetical protein